MTRWKTAKGLWMQLRLPNLNAVLTEQDFKSPTTFSYNCVGFAIGDPRWWQPSGDEVHVWPVDLPRGDYHISQYIEVFRRHGFSECEGPDAEDGFEKIAVYGTNNEFEHVAIQIAGGKWISKLGELEDIQHENPQLLEGKQYGTITAYMKRKGYIDRQNVFNS